MRGPWSFENPGCASVGGEFWFPERSAGDGPINALTFKSEEIKVAISICNSCVHKTECQQWGVKHEHHGIWGGLNENQRDAIRRRLNIIVEEVGIANLAKSVGNSSHESNTST